MNALDASLDLIFQRSSMRAGTLLRPSVVNPYFDRYKDNGLGFAQDVLRETYTPEIEEVFQSVWDTPVTLVRSGNSIGKTHLGGALVISWYKIFSGHGVQVYTFAAPPESNLKNLLWGQIGQRVEAHPYLFTQDIPSLPSMRIQRIGSPLEFVTGVTIPNVGTEANRKARFSGKHAPYILFMGDEADAVPKEVYDAIESCLSGGIMARLVLFYNPRHDSGPVAEKERRKQGKVLTISALNHPNVVTGETTYVGAVDRETVVRRINEWTRPVVSGEKVEDAEVFTVPDYLVGAVSISHDGTAYPPLAPGRRKIEEPSFYHMVLARYPAMAPTQLISQAWINRARTNWDMYVAQYGETPPQYVEAILGQDVGELGPDSSVACLRYGSFVPRLRKWGSVDPVETGDKCADIAINAGATIINIDGTGVGAGTVGQVNRRGLLGVQVNRVMSAARPDPEKHKTDLGAFTKLRDQLMWAMREWLRTDVNACLPPDENLINQLSKPTYSNDTGEVQVTRKPVLREMLSGHSPDEMDALMLTFYGEGDGDTGEMHQFNYKTGPQRGQVVRGSVKGNNFYG